MTSTDPRRPALPSQRPLMPRLAASATSVKTSPAPKLAASAYLAEAASPRPSSAGARPLHSAYKGPTTTHSPSPHRTPLVPRSATVPAQDVHSRSPNVARPNPSLAGNNPGNAAYTRSPRAATEADLPRLKSQARPPAVSGPTSPNGNVHGFVYSYDIQPSKQGAPAPIRNNPTLFFHANGEQEGAGATIGTRSSPSVAPPPHATSVVARAHDQSLLSRLSRSPSPSKGNLHLSYRKGASQIIPPNNQTSIPPISTTRAGSDSSASATHQRSSSIDEDLPSSRGRISEETSRLMSYFGTDTPQSNVETKPTSPSASIGSIRLEELAQSLPLPATVPVIPSPEAFPEAAVSSRVGSPEASDAAAKARRERKVLDLEISNSSLLAINRSLEREVRKQKLELRRMRRMARSTGNHLSIIEIRESQNYDAHDENAGVPVDAALDSDSDADSDSEDEDEASLGVRVTGVRGLQLDLTKHKEIMLDSQKMNETIKRCVGITDMLILEAKKALAYEVTAGDVGGRVLNWEETSALEPHENWTGDLEKTESYSVEDTQHEYADDENAVRLERM